jgi:hypothetical protein
LKRRLLHSQRYPRGKTAGKATNLAKKVSVVWQLEVGLDWR